MRLRRNQRKSVERSSHMFLAKARNMWRKTLTMKTSLLVGAICLAGTVASAQHQMPPAPVRYTEANEHSLQATVRLTGTVEAVRRSIVASDVAGVVAKMTVLDGDRVLEGATLAILRRKPLRLELAATRAQLDEASTRLRQAERRLERAINLYRGEVATAQQVDDTRSDRDAWQATSMSLQAQIARLEDNLERATIRAPFAGVVVRRMCEVGEWLSEGGEVVELVAMDELEIRLEVPEKYYHGLRPGQPAQIRLGQETGRDLTGTVRAIVPSADARARTFPVLVTIANEDGTAAVGMLAEVGLRVGEPRVATIVPKDAIVTSGKQRNVYVINDDSMVFPIPVEVGLGKGDWVQVIGGVRPGARVVTRGNERLFPGQPVEGEALAYELP